MATSRAVSPKAYIDQYNKPGRGGVWKKSPAKLSGSPNEIRDKDKKNKTVNDNNKNAPD